MDSEPKNGRLNRRGFLQLLGWTVGGGTAGLIANKLFAPHSEPVNKHVDIPVSREAPIEQEKLVIVDYERKTQNLFYKTNQLGEQVLVGCQFPAPAPAENGSGFVYNTKELDWTTLALPEIRIGKSVFPLLTSRQDVSKEEIAFLEEWYGNPNFIEEQLAKMDILQLNPLPIDSLVVHYQSTRNDYFASTKSGCERVFDNTPGHNPQDLQNQLTTTISTGTQGAIQYRQTGFQVISEESLPLTEDPTLTSPDLIQAYKRSMNYQWLAELAVKSNVSTVFTYTGPGAGMYESFLWTERNTGKKIRIFGLNYDLPYEYALHSWLHFTEGELRASSARDIYLHCVGRDQEYTLPYLSQETNIKNVSRMNDGRTYAAMGLGTIHLPPNAVYHYDYDDLIPVKMPGQDKPINSLLWGKTDLGYYSKWLQSIPRALFSLVQ